MPRKKKDKASAARFAAADARKSRTAAEEASRSRAVNAAHHLQQLLTLAEVRGRARTERARRDPSGLERNTNEVIEVLRERCLRERWVRKTIEEALISIAIDVLKEEISQLARTNENSIVEVVRFLGITIETDPHEPPHSTRDFFGSGEDSFEWNGSFVIEPYRRYEWIMTDSLGGFRTSPFAAPRHESSRAIISDCLAPKYVPKDLQPCLCFRKGPTREVLATTNAAKIEALRVEQESVISKHCDAMVRLMERSTATFAPTWRASLGKTKTVQSHPSYFAEQYAVQKQTGEEMHAATVEYAAMLRELTEQADALVGKQDQLEFDKIVEIGLADILIHNRGDEWFVNRAREMGHLWFHEVSWTGSGAPLSSHPSCNRQYEDYPFSSEIGSCTFHDPDGDWGGMLTPWESDDYGTSRVNHYRDPEWMPSENTGMTRFKRKGMPIIAGPENNDDPSGYWEMYDFYPGEGWFKYETDEKKLEEWQNWGGTPRFEVMSRFPYQRFLLSFRRERIQPEWIENALCDSQEPDTQVGAFPGRWAWKNRSTGEVIWNARPWRASSDDSYIDRNGNKCTERRILYEPSESYVWFRRILHSDPNAVEHIKYS